MSGGEVFDACLESLAPFGRIVTFGIASRQPNEVRTPQLMRSSRTVVGFWLIHLLERPELAKGAGLLPNLLLVAADELQVIIGGVYPLSRRRRSADCAAKTAARHGKLLLDPNL